MSKVSFNNTNNPFFTCLKKKVNNYFAENKISITGNKKLYVKGLFLTLSVLIIYTTLVFFKPPVFIAIPLCLVFGFNLATIGFNIMHEGGHQSFSKYKWLNTISAYSLNALGGTIYFWKQKHNVDHHTYTNIDGMDHDIEVKFMRIHKEQSQRKYHRFQHFYWVILYAVSYMAWVFFQDFEKYFRQKMGVNAKRIHMPFKEHVVFWVTKLFFFSIYLILPIIMLGWIKAIVGFLIAGIACGFSLSIVFQLAHVVEATSFPLPNHTSNKIDQEWAIHQICTTANFATGNKLVSWLLGGLNFQVEHHLFPRISHVHYPQINLLVKETCREFNVAYLEHRSMTEAFISHLTHIKNLGNINTADVH